MAGEEDITASARSLRDQLSEASKPNPHILKSSDGTEVLVIGTTDLKRLLARVEQNREPIAMAAQSVRELTQPFKEAIRDSNELDSNAKASATEAADRLSELAEEAEGFAKGDSSVEDEHETEKLRTWPKRFASAFDEAARATFAAESLAQAAVPTSVILVCGALGAAVAGPAGFAVGSILGNFITRQMKPGAVTSKLQEAISSNSEDDASTSESPK